MDINPYDSPSLAASIPPSDLPPTRPIGVAVLSILHSLAGLALGAFLVATSFFGDNEQWLAQRGLTSTAFAGIIALFALLALVCGIGLWLGTKWSWWLAAFYYFSMLFGDICQLILILPVKTYSRDYD